MVTITFLAEHTCLSSAISGAIDSYSIANWHWQFTGDGRETPLFKTEVVTVDGEPVTGNGGMLLQPEKSIHDVQETDLIIVPGFILPFHLSPERTETICSWLRARHAAGNLIASTCTGTFLLAQAGLLAGRCATTNWQVADVFKSKYPDVNLQIDRIFTEDSGIYCTGAATAFMDMGLHFIEKFGSADLARRCSKSLLVDPKREAQSPYIIHTLRKNHSDTEILKSQIWMEENFSEKLSIDTIAGKAAISPRHFKRRFKKATGEAPLAYLQLLRIENAKRSLETTRDTISEITWQVGYEDINSFRRLFKKHTGLSPKEYRNKFARQPGQDDHI